MNPKTSKGKSEWEKELKDLLYEINAWEYCLVDYETIDQLKSFIHNLLQQERERIIGEVEGLRKSELTQATQVCLVCQNGYGGFYNEAIDDVLKSLTTQEEEA